MVDIVETAEGKFIYDHNYYGADGLVAIFCQWCRVDDIYGSSVNSDNVSRPILEFINDLCDHNDNDNGCCWLSCVSSVKFIEQFCNYCYFTSKTYSCLSPRLHQMEDYVRSL